MRSRNRVVYRKIANRGLGLLVNVRCRLAPRACRCLLPTTTPATYGDCAAGACVRPFEPRQFDQVVPDQASAMLAWTSTAIAAPTMGDQPIERKFSISNARGGR